MVASEKGQSQWSQTMWILFSDYLRANHIHLMDLRHQLITSYPHDLIPNMDRQNLSTLMVFHQSQQQATFQHPHIAYQTNQRSISSPNKHTDLLHHVRFVHQCLVMDLRHCCHLLRINCHNSHHTNTGHHHRNNMGHHHRNSTGHHHRNNTAHRHRTNTVLRRRESLTAAHCQCVVMDGNRFPDHPFNQLQTILAAAFKAFRAFRTFRTFCQPIPICQHRTVWHSPPIRKGHR